MFQRAKWIGAPRTELEKWNILQGDLNNRFAYFCLDFCLEEEAVLKILISAVARYRLWINGSSVMSGPCKGDRYRQYYDEVNVSSYLKKGGNRLAVQVLACDSYIVNNMMKNGIQPLLALAGLPLGHRLGLEGQVRRKNGEVLTDVTTGFAPWKVYLEGSFQLEYQEPYQTWLGAAAENIPENAVSFGWKNPPEGSAVPGEEDASAALARTDITDWAVAEILEDVYTDSGNKNCGNIGALVMKEREIPFMYEKEGHFQRILTEQKTAGADAGVDEKAPKWVVVGEIAEEYVLPANSTFRIIFDAGEIRNAFMKYPFAGGKGTRVTFTYAERFVSKGREIRRDDYENGILEGFSDQIILDGTAFTYEPFWYRTFRFLMVTVRTGGEKAVMRRPYFLETGYPVEVRTEMDSSDRWVKTVWEICVRTLKRCMNETYMDCPYYEQMQFPMDTRLQALYTYLCSADARLAKKALKDFHYSIIPDGLIQGKYPCSHTQIISTFSLHYIFMLKEYYMQTGDEAIIRRYRPDIDQILDYYQRKMKNGLVQDLGYWEFVDWQSEWADGNGAPAAAAKGPSTIINLMYAYALECGAYICQVTGRPGVAEEYLQRKQSVCRNIEEKCWSRKRELYREGPDYPQYSIHAQAWAVLNGMKKGHEAAKLMQRAFLEKDLVRNSFSTSFEVFQALWQSGQYHLSEKLWENWKILPEKGCTTCPEVPENSRSECHAWSAQPIYEFIHHILGITIQEPGWKKITMQPNLSFLSDLKGKLITPRGCIFFELKKDGKIIKMDLTLPDGIDGEVITDTNERRSLTAGRNLLEVCGVENAVIDC